MEKSFVFQQERLIALVSETRQPLVACNCDTSHCTREDEHFTNLQAAFTFQIFCQPGSKINHPNPAKFAEKFERVLALTPKTVIFYMDFIMNSLTSPPWLQNSTVKSSRSFPKTMYLKDKPTLETLSLFVLCRTNEDKVELAPGAYRQPDDAPLPFESDSTIDNQMNFLLKEQFFHYNDLKLSNSAFKENDSAHQTQMTINRSLGKIIRFSTRTLNCIGF